jgi:hypothetical protein
MFSRHRWAKKMNRQGMTKQMQQVLDAAASAMDEMERWQRIATMMSHFMVCNKGGDKCKHCALATQEYMQAKQDQSDIDAEYLQIVERLTK